MTRYEATTMIARPPETVFAYLTQVDHFSDWMHRMSARQLSPGPFGLGTTFEVAEQEVAMVGEVTTFAPGVGWEARLREAGSDTFAYLAAVTLASASAGTRLVLAYEMDMEERRKSLPPNADPARLDAAAQKTVDAQVQALKEILEST